MVVRRIVPGIVRHGADWYRNLGLSEDAGTKLYWVSGRVVHPGLWELPIGTPIREIIETDNMPAKPLSLDDAILQLDLNHAEFLVFRNSENEKISVVYRRRDGNYGLIAPNG